MAAYMAYLLKSWTEHKLQHRENPVTLVRFSRECKKRWKDVPAEDKSRFQDAAKAQQQRYELEMRAYVPAKSSQGRQKKRVIKIPNAPRKPLTPFFCFSKDRRLQVKEQNPGYKFGEVSKELSRMWAVASPDIKILYDEKSKADRDRYEKEMVVHKQLVGNGDRHTST